MSKIKAYHLDPVKLAGDTYAANEATTVDAVSDIAVQASQGWGLRKHESIILRLALVAHKALEAAEKLDETERALKGKQLEVGRLKAQLARLSNTGGEGDGE